MKTTSTPTERLETTEFETKTISMNSFSSQIFLSNTESSTVTVQETEADKSTIADSATDIETGTSIGTTKELATTQSTSKFLSTELNFVSHEFTVIPETTKKPEAETSTSNPIQPLLSTTEVIVNTDKPTTAPVFPDVPETEMIRTLTTDSANVLTTLENSCEPKIWFVPQHNEDLDYFQMSRVCNISAASYENTYGHVAFFKNQTEYDKYKTSCPQRKEYLGLSFFLFN